LINILGDFIMKRSLHLVLLFGSIAGAFLAGARYTQRGPVKPLSGVPLQAVHAHGAGGHVRGSTAMSPASMEISAEKQQLIGVRVTPVEKASRTQTLRIFGRVAPDETRIYRLNAGVEGVIREVSTSHHVPLDAIRDLGRGDDRHLGRQQRLRWREA
jgi:hypothetical protein